MEYSFSEGIIEPYLHSCDSIITEVNNVFADFTGFSIDELIGKSLIEVGKMIRINSQILLANIDSEYSGFIFTKFLEAIEVDISISKNQELNETVYFFIARQNSRLEDKFQYAERLLLDNISSVAIYSSDLVLLKANQTYLEFLDEPYNRFENSIGHSLYESIHGFAGSDVEVIWQNIIKTGKTLYLKENKVDRLHIGITYWDSTIVPISEDGTIKYLIESSTEVTTSVVNRQRIAQQNELLNLSNEAIFAWDLNRGITYWNNGAEKMYGYSSKEAIGCISNELLKTVFPSYIDNIISVLDKDGTWIGKIEHTCKGDKKVIIDTMQQVIVNELGQKIVLETNRDITEQINKEAKLKYQKEQLEAIIENMPDALAFYNKEGQVILINAEARKLHPKIDTGKTVAEVHDGNQYFDLDNNVLLPENLPTRRVFRGQRTRNERIILKQSDKIKIIEVNATPVFDERHNLISAVVSHRDITEIVRNEKELKAQQDKLVIAERDKNEALEKVIQMQEEFFTNISHELKTPLNVIFATSQLLNMYCNNGSFYDKKDSVVKYIESIKQNSYRLSKLINNIVDSSKIEAGFFDINLSNNNIVHVVEDIVSSVTNYTRIKGINIIFDTDTEEKIIACDPEKIERILLNLISNAIKFSNEGDEILVAIKDNNEFVEISVKDNGIGIEEKDLTMIFDRFKQVDKSLSRRAEGTGIGLNLIKSIVELLDGSIYVESEFGKGSKFKVVLPTRKIMQENILLSNELRSKGESIQIEFSDICS